MSGSLKQVDPRDLTVLVVDDNAPMRRLLHTLLTAVNIGTVLAVPTAVQALDTLRTHAVDLLISDWQMTPMTGTELLDRVRRDPSSPKPSLPVIMVSAYTDGAVTAGMYETGVNAVLTKPIGMRTFVTTVHRVLRRPSAYVSGPAENKVLVGATV